MSTEAPRNPEGFTEEELWAQLEGQVGAERSSTLLDLVSLAMERDDFKQAHALADAAVDAAMDSDNEQMQGYALAQRGWVLWVLDQYPESAADLLQAARLSERYDSLEQTFRSYLRASWSLEAAGELEPALRAVESAILAAGELQDIAGDFSLGDAHAQRADVIRKLDYPADEVLEALSTSRQHYRSGGFIRATMSQDDKAASILLDIDNFEGAINLLRDCLAVAETQDRDRIPHFALRLGYTQRVAGEYGAALESLQRAHDILLAEQDVDRMANCLYEMAICETRLRNRDKGFDLLRRAKAHADIAAKNDLVLDCETQYAIWMHTAERYDEAIATNRRLMEMTEGWARFMARARMADNYRCQGRYDLALEASLPEQGEEDFFNRGHWFWRESIRAMIFEARGEFEQAFDIANHCLELNPASAGAFTQAKFHELKGDWFYQVHDDLDTARDWWARATALYLTADAFDDAKRLSREFLPREAEQEMQ